MKNIKYILLFFVAASMFSCEDAIDIIQPGELYQSNTFQTVNDLQLGLNGVYAQMGGDAEINHGSIWTDECRMGYSQNTATPEYGFQLTQSSDAPNSVWRGNYALINSANRLISAAKNVTPKAGDETKRYNDILTQAHIFRAWGHFKLLCYFSPDTADDNALGCIKMDHVPGTTDQEIRSSNKVIFDFINEDLDGHSFSDIYDNNANGNRKYLSPDFVKAFRARMLCYREKYAEALPLLDELITKYPLTPRTQYRYIWTDSDDNPQLTTNEVIFKHDRVSGNATIGSNWAVNNSSVTGSLLYEMSTDLYKYYIDHPSDVRKNSFVHSSYTQNNSVYPIGKYAGTGGVPMLNDLKVFRTSEMIFLKAEALAATNNLPEVSVTLKKINAVRFSGTPPPILPFTTEKAALEEIMHQRTLEMCYEGHRYLDVKRLGKRSGVSIQRNSSDCSVNGRCFISWDDYRFTFPIPTSELQANSKIQSQQNKGY